MKNINIKKNVRRLTMKKATLAMATLFTLGLLNLTAYAGQWTSDAKGWWYDYGNGTWPANTWQWIDGNNDGIAECYYFDQYGYCLMNATAPDGYTVDVNGAWTVNGTVQVRNVGKSDLNNTEKTVDMTNPKAKLEDMTPERSTYGEYSTLDYERSGENWKGSICLNVGNGEVYGYNDYYLGGKYSKLTFKAVPYDKSFSKDSKDIFIISNQETGEELYKKKNITKETNVFTGTVDVTGVNYLRLYADNKGSKGWFGYLYVKDCYFY